MPCPILPRQLGGTGVFPWDSINRLIARRSSDCCSICMKRMPPASTRIMKQLMKKTLKKLSPTQSYRCNRPLYELLWQFGENV